MARAAFLILFFVCGLSDSAAAQAVPSWMRVDYRFFGDQNAIGTKGPHIPSEPASTDVTSRLAQNRARRILAAGAGFVVSAAVTPAYVLPNRHTCWGSDRRSGDGTLKIAAGVSAVGLVAAVGGATWLALESRRHGYYSSSRERRIAAGIGAITFLVSQGLLGAAFLVDSIC